MSTLKKIAKGNDFFVLLNIERKGIVEDLTPAVNQRLLCYSRGIAREVPFDLLPPNQLRISVDPQLADSIGIHVFRFVYDLPNTSYPDGFERNTINKSAFEIVATNEEADDITEIHLKGDILIGLRGAAFESKNFTPDEWAEIQRPAIEAAATASEAANNANLAGSYADLQGNYASTATSEANAATGLANAAAQFAHDKAVAANNATLNAITAKESADTATNSANTATDNANAAADAANNAKQNADSATTSAYNAAENANEKATLANEAAGNANTATSGLTTKIDEVDTKITSFSQAESERAIAESSRETSEDTRKSAELLRIDNDANREVKSNKQSSLAPDGTGVMYPTVDAVIEKTNFIQGFNVNPFLYNVYDSGWRAANISSLTQLQSGHAITSIGGGGARIVNNTLNVIGGSVSDTFSGIVIGSGAVISGYMNIYKPYVWSTHVIIAIRYIDNNNFLGVNIGLSGNKYSIFKRINGVDTTVATLLYNPRALENTIAKVDFECYSGRIVLILRGKEIAYDYETIFDSSNKMAIMNSSRGVYITDIKIKSI